MENHLASNNNASFYRYGAMYWSHANNKYEMYLTNDQEDLIDFTINVRGTIWGTWEFQDQREMERTQDEVKRINNSRSSYW